MSLLQILTPHLYPKIKTSTYGYTTGLTTKEGEKCADRCGCEYPKGWSSGHKQCRTGDKTWDYEKCPDRCGCNMGIEGWSSSDKKCKEGE